MPRLNTADLTPGLADLIDTRLTGARCRGKAPMFDVWIPDETDEERSERLTHARQLCSQCPVQLPCRQAAAEHKASGMWGGKVHGDAGKPRSEVA